jgi:hypothetical protein
MKRGIYDNSHNNSKQRIDGRPQNSAATQAGMRGVHRDMRGNVIGGYTAEGQAMGSRDRGQSWQQRANGTTTAATGSLLQARQNLYKEMGTAGSGNLTPAMRTKAQSLGVSDSAFNAAAGRLKANEAVTPARQTAPEHVQIRDLPPRLHGDRATPAAPAPVQTPVLPSPPAATAPAPKPAAPAGPAPVSKINGMPAAQAIAQARVGAERSWAGRALTPPKSPIAKAAAPVQANTPTPAAKPSWQQAVAPVKPANATAAKTGGLEGLISQISKTRKENAVLLNNPTPTATAAAPKPAPAQDFFVAPAKQFQSIASGPPPKPAQTAPAPAPIATPPPQNGPRMVDPVQRTRDMHAQRSAAHAARQATAANALQKKKNSIKVPGWLDKVSAPNSILQNTYRDTVARYTK